VLVVIEQFRFGLTKNNFANLRIANRAGLGVAWKAHRTSNSLGIETSAIRHFIMRRRDVTKTNTDKIKDTVSTLRTKPQNIITFSFVVQKLQEKEDFNDKSIQINA
jgi:hypothetical protein